MTQCIKESLCCEVVGGGGGGGGEGTVLLFFDIFGVLRCCDKFQSKSP